MTCSPRRRPPASTTHLDGGATTPRIQILTIADLLHGAEVKMPPEHGTFRQARRVDQAAGEQLGFAVE